MIGARGVEIILHHAPAPCDCNMSSLPRGDTWKCPNTLQICPIVCYIVQLGHWDIYRCFITLDIFNTHKNVPYTRMLKNGKKWHFLGSLMAIDIYLLEKKVFLTIFGGTPQNKNCSQVLPQHTDEPWMPVFPLFLDFPVSEILTVNTICDKSLSQ